MMRRFIALATILILAVNGIACACPVEIATDHSIHQAHNDASSNDNADCCNDCDELTATNKHGTTTLFSSEKSNDYDFDAPTRYSIEVAWDENSNANEPFANRRKPFLPSTPVTAYDRMLD